MTTAAVPLCVFSAPQRLVVARAVATGTSRDELHGVVEAHPIRAVELSLTPGGLAATALVSHRGNISPASVLDGPGVACRIVIAQWPATEDEARVEGAAPGLMSRAIERHLAALAAK